MTLSTNMARLSLPHQARVPAGGGPYPTTIALRGRGSDEASLQGFSQGTMRAYAFALNQPGRVSRVLAHSSYIPLAWARQARDTLARLGAGLVYFEFPIAHNASDRSLAALAAWMDKQLKALEDPHV
ncbi:MAG: hypothetical protein IT318_12940 [Anaerolineales bacterium]|nr:hypothetical protein [Anaerolineales bacterium]